MADLAQELKKFKIPQFVKDTYPDLIPLIIETESMSDDERQYWFSILPIMTEEQVSKLREILINEREQLKKLDDEYVKQLKKINDEQIAKWHEVEVKEKWKKIKTKEATAEEKEKMHEEELLKKMQGL